ncbi:MAG: hypothetical protein R2695_09785 [Acidimicrobiales bacterium]
MLTRLMPSFMQTPVDPDPDRTYVVATTVLTVRSPRIALAFFRRLGGVTQQMRRADGMVRFGLRAQLLRMTFSTYGVFDDRRALTAFMRGEAHGEAMQALGGRLHHVTARTLERRGDDLPRTWKQVIALRDPDEVVQPA